MYHMKNLLIFLTAMLLVSSLSMRALEPADIPKLSDIYAHSQYCVPDCEFHGNISDPDLYTIAGYSYILGKDPSSINFETQPLVKYLYGISTLIFHTPIIAQIIFAVLLIFLTYKSSNLVINNKYLKLLPSTLLIIDPLFRSQLHAPYLDLPQTFFIQWFLLELFQSLKSNKFTKPLIILGSVALSKSFSVGIVLWLSGGTFLLLNRKIRNYLLTSFWALITYILGYSVFFYYHPNPVEFLKLHINILRLYKGYVPEYPKGEIFRIIISGKWRKWYDDFGLRKVDEWTVLWPISLMSLIISPLANKFKKDNYLLLHLIWIITYLGFISLRLVFPRYLMPIIPSLYLLSAYLVSMKF